MNLALALEQTLAALGKKAGLTTIPAANIYYGSASPDGGLDDSETTIKLPCLIFSVSGAEQRTNTSASRRCNVRVIVRTQRDDEKAAGHRSRFNEVHLWLDTRTFQRALADAPDITVTLITPRGEEDSQRARHLESVILLDMSVSPGKVP